MQVLDSPDVRAVVGDCPAVAACVKAFHGCAYRDLSVSMLGVDTFMRADRFLARHARYYIRELRTRAYCQFLVPYRTVTLASMGAAFGVSAAFIDVELARFIASGRVAAKIDRVAGVIETNLPDLRNGQYSDMIVKGDALLNRVQELARVINV